MIKSVKSVLLALIIFVVVLAFYPDSQKDQLTIDLPAISANPLKTNNKFKIFDTIKKGETLSGLLSKNGITAEIVQPVIEKFKDIYSVRRLKPGESYELEVDSLGNLFSFTYTPTVETKYCVLLTGRNKYSAYEESVQLFNKTKYLKGNIQTTAYDAVIDEGESPELLLAYTDIFQWDIDFFIDPRVGDQFKIVYEKSYVAESDEFVKYGKILAAQYISASDTFTAIYFNNSHGDDGYYDINGSSFQKTFLKSPLNYRRISSYFSYSRRHPILKKYRPHFGIDYAAPKGTPVSASADGVVIDKGYDKGIGYFVKIQHKNGRFVTLYGHLSRFGEGVNKGVRVKQKQIIGYVGRTGLATGPHLHYSFYDNGRPVNPLKIKNTSGDPVLPENIDRFNSLKQLMLSHLAKMDQSNIPLVLNTASQVHYNRYTIPDR